MVLLKLIGVALGGIFLAEVAPRLLIRSDLERFFGAEGPAIQYTGIAHVLTRQAYCGGGPSAFTCTARHWSVNRWCNETPVASRFHRLRLGDCSIPLPWPELSFFRVPSAVGPNYESVVVHPKLVVNLLPVWRTNSVVFDRRSHAFLRRYFGLHCDWHGLHKQDLTLWTDALSWPTPLVCVPEKI